MQLLWSHRARSEDRPRPGLRTTEFASLRLGGLVCKGTAVPPGAHGQCVRGTGTGRPARPPPEDGTTKDLTLQGALPSWLQRSL